MKQYIISAGHHLADRGVIVGEYHENEIIMKIRDFIIEKLPTALYPEDNLTLKQTIDFINDNADDDTLSLDLHLNYHSNKQVRGTEVYYYGEENKEKADELAQKISENLGIPNRGSRKDTQSFVGELGFCRKTKGIAFVVEVLYLSNETDRTLITTTSGQQRIADAVIDAIESPQSEIEVKEDGLLFQLFLWLKRYFALLRKDKNVGTSEPKIKRKYSRKNK